MGHTKKFLCFYIVLLAISTHNSHQKSNECYTKENLPECPEDFTNHDNLCYILIQNSTFPPKCPFGNVVQFQDYIDTIEVKEPIWMPVQRNLENGLGVLEWTEVSDKYKLEYNGSFQVVGSIKGKNCLVYHNNTYKELVSCNATDYAALCVYKKMNEISSNQACSSLGATCSFKDFDPKLGCICVGDGSTHNRSQFTEAEFLKPYQNRVYDSLTNENCTIALRKTAGKFVWLNSVSNFSKDLEYCYWYQNFNEKNGIFGAISPQAWILTPEPLNCFLYEQELDFSEPYLILRADDNGLVLETRPVQSVTFKIFCFHDFYNSYRSLRYSFSVSAEIRVDFKAGETNWGRYWCETFRYTDSEPVSSNVVFYNQTQNFEDEFVANLEIPYTNQTDLLTSDFIDSLELSLSAKINDPSNKCSYTPRVMKINELNEENCEISVNAHITCRLVRAKYAGIVSPKYEIFNEVKDFLNETLNEINITLAEFRSVSYCPQENLLDLVWPTTNISKETFPKNYCFTGSGVRLKRLCGGDFLNGAMWTNPDENCTIPNYSSVTDDLLNWDPFLNPPTYLADISGKYSEFKPLDVFIITSLVLQNLDSFSMSLLGTILDNVLKTDAEILILAQEEMRALDYLLNLTDQIAKRGNINSQNLVSFEVIEGFILLKNSTTVKLNHIDNFQNLLGDYPDMEAAFWANEETNFIVKIIYNNIFFSISNNSKQTGNIFGVVLKENQNIESLQIFYKTNVPVEGCVFWNYNLETSEGRGHWEQINKRFQNESFLLCSLNVTKDISATTILFADAAVSVSITESLEDLLKHSENPEETIGQLANISDMYDQFTSNDVYLVAEVLTSISSFTRIDLDDLGHIVDNLHRIQRSILLSSQKDYLATDVLLNAVDTILKNHDYQEMVNVTKDNFMILIADIKQTNFSGLILFENEKIVTKKITSVVNVTNVMDDGVINAVLFLPPGLREQLPDGSKISITIFSTDGLFNPEVTKSKFVSKIFGVILPAVDFAEPLTFIYKVDANSDASSCSYWSYDLTEKITGFWQHDNNVKNMSTCSKCEFWHTTHFALLILDSLSYDDGILDWITKINCGLSIFGLLVIILTALLFKRWRTNTGNQILLNFVLASIIQICVFYTSNVVNKNKDAFLCTTVGIILHYSIISQFCWMFVIAVLQFKRFVEVLQAPPKHVLLKGCLCGWFLPVLPVACVYAMDNNNYKDGSVGLCYPSGLGLYLGVWLPTAIIIAINGTIFLYIIYSVTHKKTECSDVGSSDLLMQWRLAILLFFMLGITWSFGFLAELDFGIVFVYVFCVTATLQGFVMFLFFIVFNTNTRYLYLQCFQSKKYH